MSRERAVELTRMRDELQKKFADAMKSVNDKIAAEEREEEDTYAVVGKAAADLAAKTGSTAAGILALRTIPRQGGPRTH